jgi:hypothetical protein
MASLKLKYEKEQIDKWYKIAKWNQDWYEQAVKDYLWEYVSLLDPREFWDLLLWIWSFIYNIDKNLEKIPAELSELKEIYINREEIFAWLWDYKKQYFTTYLETNLWLMIIPIKIGKVKKITKWVDSKDISELKKLKEKIPDYILSNRTPIVSETFLKTWYIKTSKQYSGATIYKNNEWNYFYIDTFHIWKWSHIEVFDSSWIHLWEADPISWIINYSKSDKDKLLLKNLR